MTLKTAAITTLITTLFLAGCADRNRHKVRVESFHNCTESLHSSLGDLFECWDGSTKILIGVCRKDCSVPFDKAPL